MNATVHQLRPEADAVPAVEDIALNVTDVAHMVCMAATADPNRNDPALAALLDVWETLTGLEGHSALAYAERVARQRSQTVAFVTPLPANTANPCDRSH